MTASGPVANFRFQVDIEGIAQIGFSEVAIAETSVDVIDYREGNDTVTRKLPGLHKVGDVTFKRGVIASNELFDWWKTVADGQVQRRKVGVSLLDEQRTVVRRWVMRNVWPVRYAVSPLIAVDGCVAATETLVCAVESLTSETA
jgi:phage tail-like protein